MKKLIMLAMATTLVGCSSVPSFWDDNESYRIIDIRYDIDTMDCTAGRTVQAEVLLKIKSDIRWLELYADSKGSNDLLNLIAPMAESVNEWQARFEPGVLTEQSTFYCESKKEILEQQARLVAEGILGRY